MSWYRFFPGMLLWLACAPSSVDRASLSDALAEPVDARATAADSAGTADARGVDGAGAQGGRGGPDAPADRARPMDAPPPRDTAPRLPDVASDEDARPADLASEAPASQTVLLVVGVLGQLSTGDNRLRTAIASRGLTPRIVDDNAGVDLTGARLVVLSGSCASATLGTKYRDVMVPLLSTEAAVYDTMGMTGGGTGLGRTVGGSLNILMPGHPLAAGLLGTVAVVSTSSNLGWGRPGPGAQRVASIPGTEDQVAIFGYAKGAMMASGPAADRRVGFFATDDAAPNLGADGQRLLGAAIDWVLLP